MAGGRARCAQAARPSASASRANVLTSTIILKLNSDFNSVGPPGRRAPQASPPGYNPRMPEALDVTCPCCQASLKVDPETGAVVWAEEKKGPARDFDELVSRVRSNKSVLDEKFQRSVQQTRRQSEILDKKFEEARRRAETDPNVRPPHPFDNE
jgi:hypothetical protein